MVHALTHISLTTCAILYTYMYFPLEKPPIEYWQVLAEQRRLALADTLQENEEVHIHVHIHVYTCVHVEYIHGKNV